MTRFAVIALALCLGGCGLRQVPNPNDPNQVSPTRRVELIQLHLDEAKLYVDSEIDEGHIDQAKGDQLLAEDTATFLAGLNLSDIPPEGDLTVAMAYLVARDRKDADSYLKRLKEIPPGDCLKVAQAFLASGDPVTAKQYLQKLKDVPLGDRWKVARAYMDLKDWKSAEIYLQLSIDAHISTDRTVNDTLFYAYCQAELGDVEGAITTTHKTFATISSWKWPILYAVHFQIVPAALKAATTPQKIELAKLVEDAIEQHLQATGDRDTPHFQGWFLGRKHLLTASYQQAIEIYADAGRIDLAKHVEDDREAWQKREPVEPKKLPPDAPGQALKA